MRDRDVRFWRTLIRHRADREWRELPRDVLEELACHLEDLHAAAIRAGASENDARHQALDALNAASLLELSKRPRAKRGTGYLQDARLALRQLIATPVVTIVAVLSLALGIGANTALFSMIDSLVLRALPVKAPDRLVLVTDVTTRGIAAWTNPIWEALRARRDLVTAAFAWSTQRLNLASGGEAEFADAIWASGGMFDALGVPPILGRLIAEPDDRRGGGPDGAVVVLSYAFWQRRFGGAADAMGRTLTIERVPFTIIGVTPPDFFGPDVGRTFDVVIPIGSEPLIRGKESFLDRRSTWWLTVMLRLRPSQSMEAATAALRGVQRQVRAETAPTDWPANDLATYLSDPFMLVPAATGDSALRRRYERPLVTILIVVALVLLIACANIANLMLARASARRHEWGVRLALGASRWRLVRLLLIESLVMSMVGAVLGLVIAQWGSRLLVRELSTQTNSVFLELSIDWRVLAFTTGITIVTALLFGMAPAFRVSQVPPVEALKENTRAAPGDRRANLASALVVAQVALSLMLVVAASLFIRTFASLANAHLGFDPDRVLLVTVNMLRTGIAPTDRLAAFDRVRRAVSGVPGVAAVGVAEISLVAGQTWNNRIVVSGGIELPDRQRQTNVNAITPGWLGTYSTPVIGGRDIAATDSVAASRVALVNEAFARKFLNGANPLGHTVQTVGAQPTAPREIVGVVADAVYRNIREPVPPTVYVPLAQRDTQPDRPAPAQMFVSVRSVSGHPALLTRSVAAAILSVDADLALTFRSLTDQVNASLTQERIIAVLSGFFGGLALVLAGLGLYGVTAYAVSRRRAEIAIRMAVGAAPRGVITMVLRRVSLLVVLGVLAGGAISWWASQYVASLLFGVQPRDPTSFAASAAVLAMIGAIAGWVPAYRASRLDPSEVLRTS